MGWGGGVFERSSKTESKLGQKQGQLAGYAWLHTVPCSTAPAANTGKPWRPPGYHELSTKVV